MKCLAAFIPANCFTLFYDKKRSFCRKESGYIAATVRIQVTSSDASVKRIADDITVKLDSLTVNVEGAPVDTIILLVGSYYYTSDDGMYSVSQGLFCIRECRHYSLFHRLGN